jgi:nitrite reductase/ring-hydroxylating ferredoxin subunit/uncharacterized membrane protein
MHPSSLVERLISRLEQAESLDRPAQWANDLLSRLIRPGTVEDLASGTPSGHPAHPPLAVVPIGAWTVSALLDLTGADEQAVRRAAALGTVVALPTVFTGANDWLSTSGAERRVGLVHAATMDLGLIVQVAAALTRRRGSLRSARVLTMGAMAIVATGGWLGGHLAYALGVGVDTTAFSEFPADWTDVAGEADVRPGDSLAVDVGGVSLLLAREGHRVVALADRCTHRGGPLAEGALTDGCVTCPWHGSRFRLGDGAVQSGPATRPQPTLDVDVRDGRIFVRRPEARSLRTNPVGR